MQDAKAARVLKQLILTADDFGRSLEINTAIERAHRAGFLTQASLMVNEPAVDDAVRIARRNPALCIGLHLTLCDGRAARISPLTDRLGNLPPSPALSGSRYFFSSRLALPLRDEIRSQFERFRALGFAPSYWDGHTHLHLHPTILRLTLPVACEHHFQAIRLVREPGPPAFLPFLFQALSRAALPQLIQHNVRYADHIFGLRDTGRMTSTALTRCLENLPDGLNELYFHPGTEPAEPDYADLVALLARRYITLRTSLPPQTAR